MIQDIKNKNYTEKPEQHKKIRGIFQGKKAIKILKVKSIYDFLKLNSVDKKQKAQQTKHSLKQSWKTVEEISQNETQKEKKKY